MQTPFTFKLHKIMFSCIFLPSNLSRNHPFYLFTYDCGLWFEYYQLLNKLDNAATGANLLSPPEMPFNAIRRTSEGSAWGTSISVESGSEEEEDYEEDAKDSTAAEDGGTSAGNGAGTDGASDGAGERRGSNVKDLLDKRKKGDRRRRKPDKQGKYISNQFGVMLHHQ